MSKRKKPGKCTCVLCGRPVFRGEKDYVTGSTGRVVCSGCLGISRKLLVADKETDSQQNANGQVIPPQEIIRKLDHAIIGQERAKRAAVALWKQQLRANGDSTVPRANLLLYGPTGCGKTALVREAANIVDLPFISFDSTTLSEAGYRGRDAKEIIQDLESRFENHPKLRNDVIFMDELDKLASKGNETRMAYNRGTQHTLLKLVEGTEIEGSSGTFSTEGLLFIFGGAFTGIASKAKQHKMHRIGFIKPEDTEEEANDVDDVTVAKFVSFGMGRELMGRIGQCVPLDALSEDELKHILLESSLSAFLQYQKFFLA